MKIDKPGYYINENNNLVIAYPAIQGITVLQVYNKEAWIDLEITEDLLSLLNKTIEFTYIGEL